MNSFVVISSHGEWGHWHNIGITRKPAMYTYFLDLSGKSEQILVTLNTYNLQK